MKPTVAQKKTAFDIMKSHGVEVVFMNKDGEFFTKQNLAELSVNKKTDLVKLYKPILEKELRSVKPKTAKPAKATATPSKKPETADETKSEDTEESADSETQTDNE
ncbi:hypothetical protein [Flammeovirga sp. OC4]|uniref:hypothetical protein n=1 Tax=Flammeovirga sp. OC4 TaxID=1382345 RepID=UPI00069410FF|nr:hypothetical protein [Flammeovirga sp. OC4]